MRISFRIYFYLYIRDMKKLRLLRPLFEALRNDIDEIPHKMKKAFWALGNSIVNAVRVGTIFDEETTWGGEGPCEDNFDFCLDTEEQYS